MFDFIIQETKNTPLVQFFVKQNKLIFSGKAFPENARKFFDDILVNFRAHLFTKEFTIIIDLDYISSSSVISILELLKKLKNQSPTTQFKIDFYYDDGDDDMLSIGENYKKITDMDFNFISR